MTIYNGLKYNEDFTICFGPKSKILEVAILHPNTKIIERNSFKSCTELKEVVLNENLESIQNLAFSGCKHLEKIDFPASLKEIKNYSFDHTAMKELNLSKCKNLILYGGAFLGSKIESVSLPDTLQEIPPECFAYTNITNFICPESLQIINRFAFSECDKLKTFDTGNVKIIAFEAFNSTGLEKINFGEVENIATAAFNNCKNLKEINLENTKIEILRPFVFKLCTNLEKIILPPTVKILNIGCLESTKVTSLNIPSSVTIIKELNCENTIKCFCLDKSKIKESKNVELIENSLDYLLENKSFKEINKMYKNNDFGR